MSHWIKEWRRAGVSEEAIQSYVAQAAAAGMSLDDWIANNVRRTEREANFNTGPPGGGGPTPRPPSQQNWPGSGMPYYGGGGDPLGGYGDPYGVPGGNPGGYTTGDSYGAPGGQGRSSDVWKQLALYGIPILQNYLGARQQKGQAGKLEEAQRRQRAETLALASPERYEANYARYLEDFKKSYRPWLVGEQDRAAIGEQGAMQAFDTDVSRRGLGGSGLALAGRSAIRTGRQAQVGENMRRYWQMTDEAARHEAGQTRSAEINASLGAPYTYVPRQSTTNAAVQGLGDAYRDWLWLQGTGNNPFVSKKPRDDYWDRYI